METRCFSFLRDCNTHGTTNSGSVCIQTLPPTSSIHCMETRPRQYSNRCISSSLGQGVQFCDTHMANSPPVCTTSLCSHDFPCLRNLLTNRQDKNYHLIETGWVIEATSVEGFRKSLQMEGISSNAAKPISHSTKEAQQLIMNRPGVSGLAFAVKDKLIIFKHL